MSEKNTGGPAFPNTVKVTDEAYAELRGMTLRDYFAAKALPAVVEKCPNDTRLPGESLEAYFARRAYLLADAMLKARES